MKRKPIILMLLLVFLCCGCEATLNIGYNDLLFNSEIIVEDGNQTSNSILNSLRQKIKISNDTIYKETGQNSASVLQHFMIGDDYEIAYNKYAKTHILGLDNGDIEITISNFKVFDLYPELDKITINIVSPYKANSNADSVDKQKHTWVITKNNFENSEIDITIGKELIVTDNDSKIIVDKDFIIFISILICILLIISVAISYFKIIGRRNNKI